MSRKGTFAFVQLGCNANRADAERIAEEFNAVGLTEAKTPDNADALVVMTCAFTHERQGESLREIEAALKLGPRRLVIVSGCLPGICPSAIVARPGLQVVQPDKFDRTVIAKLWPDLQGDRTECVGASDLWPRRVKRIRVSRGCAGHCAFCVIPRASGPLRSRDREDIRRDVLAAVSAGFREIVLAGEDVGAYGRERGESLAALLRDLLSLDGDFQLAVESINPQWLARLLCDYPSVVAEERMSRHWYIPLQAATDSLLRIMRRPYKVGQAVSSLEELRKLRPDACLVTDLIVGHPGERAEDIRESIALFHRFSFDYVEIMKFDSHEGTLAKVLPGQVSEAERHNRVLGLILSFVRALVEHRRIRGCEAIASYVAGVRRLPINTNLRPTELLTTLAGARRRRCETALGELAEVIEWARNCSGPDGDFAAEVIARIGPPRAVNLDQYECDTFTAISEVQGKGA